MRSLKSLLAKRVKGTGGGTPLWWYTNYPLRMLGELGIRKGDLFLDVGSGPGFQVIGAWLKGARAIGIDVNKGSNLLARNLAAHIADTPEARREDALKSMIEEVHGHQEGHKLMKNILSGQRAGSTPGMEFITSDATRLPLPSDSVDKIVSMDAVHWVKSNRDREKMLKEILRVAKPGARIMLMSIPYPYWQRFRRVKISAAEHFARIAEKEGAKLSLSEGSTMGRRKTYVLLSKKEKTG